MAEETITISKDHYKLMARVVLDSDKKNDQLGKFNERLMRVIEQQQASTRTIEVEVCEYLNGLEMDYMQSGIMSAIDRGLYNCKIVPISPTEGEASGNSELLCSDADQRPNWIVKQESEQKIRAAILTELRALFKDAVVTHQQIIEAVEDCEAA